MGVASKKVKLRKSWRERREENPRERDRDREEEGGGMCKVPKRGSWLMEVQQLVQNGYKLEKWGRAKQGEEWRGEMCGRGRSGSALQTILSSSSFLPKSGEPGSVI